MKALAGRLAQVARYESKSTSLTIPNRCNVVATSRAYRHEYEVHNANYRESCTDELLNQGFMQFMGATLPVIEPGFIEIRVPFRDDLGLESGCFHTGLVATLADNSSAVSVLTLLHPGLSVLTVEYKINFFSPAKGDTLVAHGHVLKIGHSISTCRSEVFVETNGRRKLVAALQSTVYGVSKADYVHQKIPRLEEA